MDAYRELIQRHISACFMKDRCMYFDYGVSDDEPGIVVLADIADQVLARDRAPDRVNLYEIMTKPVIGVDPAMNIRYCARLFSRFGLSTAPVVENRDIVGVVTYREMVLKGLLSR